MTYRDPKNPAPRRGQGSRGDASGRAQPRGADDAPAGSRSTANRPPVDRRRDAGRGGSSREAATRSRPAVPTPSSRHAGDPFAEPVARRQRTTAAPAPDPFTVTGRARRETQPRPVSDDPNDPAAWGDLADDWTEPGGDAWEELPAVEPARRTVSSRRAPREPARVRVRARPALSLGASRLPELVGRTTLLTDQTSGVLIGANLLSLIVMVIRLATQLGQLPPSLVVHVDAAGNPDLWGTPAVLWRLPLIAGMSLLMNLVVAWFVAPIDRFAARFALAAALGVQLIVWVAVLELV